MNPPIGRFYLADLSADVQGSNWQGFIAKGLNKSLQELDLHNCLVLVKNPDSLVCGSYTTRNMLLLIGDSIFLADRYGKIARPVLSDSAKNANEKNETLTQEFLELVPHIKRENLVAWIPKENHLHIKS